MALTLTTSAEDLRRAAGLLRDGGLVAFGTETVYGLGADATNAGAVAAIFAAKQRPQFNPLICHYASADAAFTHSVPTAHARLLAERFWPGPLTLVLRRTSDCPVALLASAGRDTLAIRVPRGESALALLRLTGRPVAAPSANRSGRISPTTAAHVQEELGDQVDAVVDCGPCPVGVESTVVDLSGPDPILLRAGGVPLEDIEAVIGAVGRFRASEVNEALPSPGLLASHYAPGLAVRLDAEAVGGDEVLLAFGAAVPGTPLCMFQLSTQADPTEAASRLFEGLRWLDREGTRLGAARIAVMPIPPYELGLAINDRLSRAAAPRDLNR